jgi:hypothetical protein
MALDASEAQILRDLEEQLLRPEVRSSAEAVAALLADEFVEFGSSGRIYDKPQIVALLQQEGGQGGRRTVRDFVARQLADGVILVTYRVVESRTIRSSIWKCAQGRWQMVFHQGTRSAIP